MTKQTIEVEVPEGWKLTKLKIPAGCIEKFGTSTISSHNIRGAFFDLEKIQPNRIVLEETLEETNEGIQHFSCSNSIQMTFTNTKYKWREATETEEPKLSLSVAECKDLQVIYDVKLSKKIQDFIKEN